MDESAGTPGLSSGPSRLPVGGRPSVYPQESGGPRTPAQDDGGPSSLLDLAPGGVHRATPVTRCAVVSYTAVPPIPVHALAVCSLRHCAAEDSRSSTTGLPGGARAFLGIDVRGVE